MTFSLALACAAPYAARAQEVSTSLRFRLAAWPDAAIEGSGLAAALVPVLWSSSLPHATCAPCDPSGLWAVDRGTIGPIRDGADLMSSATLVLEAGLGAAFLASSRAGQGGAFLEDALVIAQAVTATEAVTEWAKILFQRPRPYLYLQSATSPGTDAGRSFPSGHTSVAFAAAAAYASILHRRGIAKSHAADIGVLFGTALATAVLRVAAHRHFPTDVAAGAALGFAIGWTLPALHATRP